ncbi:MAG: tRNA 2-selenouridine(34) synthase MnmH, partial [Pseudohongiellaceae bacterium]
MIKLWASASMQVASLPVANYAGPGCRTNGGTLKQNMQCRDYLEIFLNDVALMDVRAPVEFARGAFPMAKNRPLLDDDQRQQIGLRYRQSGQEAAIALGEDLATEQIRSRRLADWRQFLELHPDACIYCFRGGLRSHIAQSWLAQSGLDCPLVAGGYKAMRTFLLASMNRLLQETPLLLLSGPTGSGKTRLLQRLPRNIDLEGLARHRGSAFGRTLAPQPAQISWENAFAIALLKQAHAPDSRGPLLLEDEGRLIGRIALPQTLQQTMKQADLLVLEESLEDRVRLIIADYIDEQWSAYREYYAEKA